MTLCRRSPRPYGLIGAVALAMTGSMLVGSTPALAQKSGGPADRQQTAQAAQAPTPQAPRRAPVPASAGSPGAGDPYFPTYGNGGYRVRHYNVDASFSPATERLHGRTVISARATKNLSRFNLDLVLPASKVTVNGLPAKHRHTRHELIVKPRHQLLRGQPMRIVVHYGGVPKNHKVGGAHPWVTTKDGAVAVGEPEIAAWWFPSNDHPSDKATFDITLHVPRGVEAISNGRLVRKRTAGKRSVWHWSENDPMATYLAFAAIGQYDIVRGHTAGGRPYLYAYSKQLKHQRFARKSVGQTGRITAWLQRTWGAYPFHEIGGVVLGKWIGFALENQTRPVYSRAFFEFSRDRRTVAHEMAHQWFGDKVSVDNWRDIWLNEGFATYTEWLYQHHIAGASVDTIFKRKYASNPRKSGFWSVHVGAPGRHRLFSAPIYDRGAMTLHALRHKIGSRAFFRLARSWVRNTDGNGSTREFVHAAERVSGQQLDRFFHVWLSTGSRPRSTVANGFPRKF